MINLRQLELYKNLMSISSTSMKDSSFYFVDQDLPINTTCGGWKYRIFGYMMAKYSDFIQSDALWARGTMFLINERQEPQQLVCLPTNKFFNLNENPIAMVSDRLINEDIVVMEKRDGSLMSQYLDIYGNLRLKSKMSTKSDHCLKAMQLLNSNKYAGLKDYLIAMSHKNITVDLEWTSPNNRIVLGYDTDSLTILSARDLSTLSAVDVKNTEWSVKTYDKIVLTENKEGIEGYVVELNDGLKVKIKTDWYCLLHKNKESISTPYNLYEICLNDQADDLIALFVGDDLTIQQITSMQEKAKQDYFNLKDVCTVFYNDNKYLDRKTYAIKGQQSLASIEFSLVMTLYSNKEPDYVKSLLKRFKDENRETETAIE